MCVILSRGKLEPWSDQRRTVETSKWATPSTQVNVLPNQKWSGSGTTADAATRTGLPYIRFLPPVRMPPGNCSHGRFLPVHCHVQTNSPQGPCTGCYHHCGDLRRQHGNHCMQVCTPHAIKFGARQDEVDMCKIDHAQTDCGLSTALLHLIPMEQTAAEFI